MGLPLITPAQGRLRLGWSLRFLARQPTLLNEFLANERPDPSQEKAVAHEELPICFLDSTHVLTYPPCCLGSFSTKAVQARNLRLTQFFLPCVAIQALNISFQNSFSLCLLFHTQNLSKPGQVLPTLVLAHRTH